MNKMDKIKSLAEAISFCIENLEQRKEYYNNCIEEVNEKIEELLKQETPDEWNLKYRRSDFEQYTTQIESIDEIIKYLENYKF